MRVIVQVEAFEDRSVVELVLSIDNGLSGTSIWATPEDACGYLREILEAGG